MTTQLTSPEPVVSNEIPHLIERFLAVRRFTEQLTEPLAPEDMVVQSMTEASPTRWHLAHMTWFFETFVLKRANPAYRSCNPAFEYLFNSYYNQVGPQFPRPRRGLLSRPTVPEVFEYRRLVDQQVVDMLEGLGDPAANAALLQLLETGLHHEQQHQELLLTDIKHVLSCNPLFPAYRERNDESASAVGETRWVGFPEGLRWIGHDGAGFGFDHERPRHRVFVHAFQIADRLVTNGEFLAFIDDGGYERPALWLSDGWATVEAEDWSCPLYWHRTGESWSTFTLAGLRPVEPNEPVAHLSYYEADAFARWAGARLPTEAEWETAAEEVAVRGNFADAGRFHPRPAAGAETLRQLFGDTWEWTASPYAAYPGYRPAAGVIGEYNGKFMCNQFVLRGGSCATPADHVRRTYRNFFPPAARWQFSGLRLAKDA